MYDPTRPQAPGMMQTMGAPTSTQLPQLQRGQLGPLGGQMPVPPGGGGFAPSNFGGGGFTPNGFDQNGIRGLVQGYLGQLQDWHGQRSEDMRGGMHDWRAQKPDFKMGGMGAPQQVAPMQQAPTMQPTPVQGIPAPMQRNPNQPSFQTQPYQPQGSNFFRGRGG